MSFGNTSSFNPLFSHGANNVIAALDPGGRRAGDSIFPNNQGWDNAVFRFDKSENVQEWFRRIVGAEDQALLRIEQCAIEEELALFGRVAWNVDGIYFCNL